MQHSESDHGPAIIRFVSRTQPGGCSPRNSHGQSTMRDMPDSSIPTDPQVYKMLFEQMPTVIRWGLGVLTLGFFTLAGWLWLQQIRNVERVERQVHARIDRLEQNFGQRMDEMNRHLIEIARNTSK